MHQNTRASYSGYRSNKQQRSLFVVSRVSRIVVISIAIPTLLMAAVYTVMKTSEAAGTDYASAHGGGIAPASASGKSPESSWQLRLVNPSHGLPEGYSPPLAQLSNGHAIDERCAGTLQSMLEDCRAAGLDPRICSAYRERSTQEQLFAENVRELRSQGYTQTEAEAETARTIALPGTSEHELGLAVDIVDANYQPLDIAQAGTPAQQWLMKNCWRYGFVLRYPSDKVDITGIEYEPWHYRYVGKEAAEELCKQHLCLEEYLKKQP